MTNILKPYTKGDIEKLTRKRSGEDKIGEAVQYVSSDWKKDLENTDAKFVVIGIAEDIGVRANYGRAGAATAFRPALDSFLNQQNNDFLKAESVFILGEILVDDLMHEAENLDMKNKNELVKLRELVSLLDERVSEVIKLVVTLNKVPVVIGGGHNNSYGNIKGASQALGRKINVINCDPHLDFRPLEGRHSGNGFSYAYENNFLNRYAVLAMHEQYNNQGSIQKFKEHPVHLFYTTYESVFVREELNFKTALNQCIGFVKEELCGLEIDLDAITNVPSSAKTSSGISPTQARQYVDHCARNLKCLYFHIAEGAPVLSHIKADNKTGKLIAYLMTDFIKASFSQNK
ncbi:arginase [Sphingobacteriaceae bacterium]|nr:arginase [Sphingobacteriaceae bacterium]